MRAPQTPAISTPSLPLLVPRTPPTSSTPRTAPPAPCQTPATSQVQCTPSMAPPLLPQTPAPSSIPRTAPLLPLVPRHHQPRPLNGTTKGRVDTTPLVEGPKESWEGPKSGLTAKWNNWAAFVFVFYTAAVVFYLALRFIDIMDPRLTVTSGFNPAKEPNKVSKG